MILSADLPPPPPPPGMKFSLIIISWGFLGGGGVGLIFTVRNSSFGKVCLSTELGGEGGYAPLHAVIHSPSRQTHPPGQIPPPGRHTLGIPHRDGHCSGRYASYWKAFLLLFVLTLVYTLPYDRLKFTVCAGTCLTLK